MFGKEFKMNIFKSESFRQSLMGLDEKHLFSLRVWYEKKGDKGVDELRLIDLEIERRAKLRRYYENFS